MRLEKLQRQNLALWEGWPPVIPPTPITVSEGGALTVDTRAPLLEKRGRENEAEQCLRRVVELRRSLTEDFPNTPHHFCKLAEAARPSGKDGRQSRGIRGSPPAARTGDDSQAGRPGSLPRTHQLSPVAR